jgi:hypothetical protein
MHKVALNVPRLSHNLSEEEKKWGRGVSKQLICSSSGEKEITVFFVEK